MGKAAAPAAAAAAAAVEKLQEGKKKKGKKKGRPSLLDIQKRNLRLQKQHELELELERQQQQRRRGQGKSPSPNPSNPLLQPSPAPRSSVPSPDSNSAAVEGSRGDSGDDDGDYDDDDDDDGDEEEGGTRTGRRRQRKLRLVLRLSPNGWGDHELGASSSGSEGDGRAAVKKRRIDTVGGSAESETEKQRSASRLTHASLKGEPPGAEGVTSLPDKQLLVFILDRLQKKDTYGVFSEPVDRDELPDYHDVIEFPMDFSTVRKKLSRGAYANLEEFEEDVFLISSNAMRYNAPDTIYFRQARAIQEIAKKDFDNLRQDSDNSELESKPVSMSKISVKDDHSKVASRPHAEHGVSNDSVVPIPTSNHHQSTLITDASDKLIDSDKRGTTELLHRAFQKPLNGINHTKLDEHKPHRKDEPSAGFWIKEPSLRHCKKITASEENGRCIDKQNPASDKQNPTSVCAFQPSILTTFDEEMKELVTVGVHVENSYARSLARFAAKFGPIGWEIAVKLIKRSLPPGTRFGRGWVGEKDPPPQNWPPLPSKFSLATSPSLLPYRPCEAKGPTGKGDRSSLITFGKSLTSHEIHLPSGPEIGTTKHTNKMEHDIVFKPTRENVLDTGTYVKSNNLVSRPNRGIQPADNGHVETTTGFFGPTSNAAETPENSAMPNMVAEGKTNFMHPVEAGRAMDSAASSAHLSTCTTKASKLNEEKVNAVGPTTVNSASNVLHSKTTMHMESEMTRIDHSRTLNSMSNFIRQSSSRHLDNRGTNPAKFTKSMDDFVHPAAISSLGTEKVKINNQHEVNRGNGIFCSLTAGHVEEEKATRMGTANPCSGDGLLQPTGKLLFESELAKRGMLGLMNSRRVLKSAATGIPPGERTAASERITDSGGVVVEQGKDCARWSLQGLSLSQNAQSLPPDLNIRFQSPGSPTTAVMVDSQQPDLALQL